MILYHSIGANVEAFVPASKYNREKHCCFGKIVRVFRSGVTVQNDDGQEWSVSFDWVRPHD